MRGFGPCWMTPATMSPSRPRNSPSTLSSPMSRRRWLMTCFAANAAMRPKSSGLSTASPIDLALVVELGHVDGDVTGLAIELDAGTRLGSGIRVLEVRGEDRLLDDDDEFLERDLALALHRAAAR